MKGVTISTGTSATMTSDFRRMKKASAVYAASKGWEHWPGVIGNMEPIADTKWKTKRPNKSEYATKRTTKLKNEDRSEIIKEEWIVTDCEKQDELEDNHSNMQCQKRRNMDCTARSVLLSILYCTANYILILSLLPSNLPPLTLRMFKQTETSLAYSKSSKRYVFREPNGVQGGPVL